MITIKDHKQLKKVYKVIGLEPKICTGNKARWLKVLECLIIQAPHLRITLVFKMGKTIFQFNNNLRVQNGMEDRMLFLVNFYKRLSRKKSSIFPEYEGQYEEMLYTTYKNLVRG
jgi:hypothetical protein